MSVFETIGAPDQLAAVTEFVRQAARTASFGDADLSPIDLIVEEIFLNIALHGYPPGEPGRVEIECTASGPRVFTICFRDWAKAFDPLLANGPVAETPLEQRRIGGLGVLLVKRMADSISYRRTKDANELSVRVAARAAGA